MKPPLNLNRKGIVLVSAVALSMIFIIIIVPLMGWSANEYSWTWRSFMSLRALNIADAGAELAVWEVVHNNAQFIDWSGGNPKTLNLNSFTDNLGDIIGDAAVSVDNTSPGNYLVTSAGYIPSVANYKVKKTVKVKVFPHPLFNNGIFGYASVTASGNTLVDSYNSDDGPYTPATAGNDGDIGTNGIITFQDNSVVKGDAFVGPDGAVSGNTSDHLTGETYYYGNEVEFEEFELPNSFIILPSQGNLAIGGDDALTIPSGDYRYESISADGKAALTISDNTRIYVHNDFYIGGQATAFTGEAVEIYIGGNGSFAGQGIVNTSGVPNNLRIYGLGDDTTLSYTGQNDFYGTIYAPESTVYLSGNSNYYGAVVGDSVTLAGNVKFHYDEALSQNGPFSGYDIAYWQED